MVTRGDERVSVGDKEGWTGDVLLRPAVMASGRGYGDDTEPRMCPTIHLMSDVTRRLAEVEAQQARQ